MATISPFLAAHVLETRWNLGGVLLSKDKEGEGVDKV
jgi:hypothetical protein